MKIFIDPRADTNSTPICVYPASLKVTAYPCARRRSVVFTGSDGKPTQFPFDPEARLNTEYNHRKATGINGFTHSFVSELSIVDNTSVTSANVVPSGSVAFTIAGYSFNVNVDGAAENTDDNIVLRESIKDASQPGADYLGKVLASLLQANEDDVKAIYANIIIETQALYDGNNDGMYYDSWMLKKQVDDGAETALDVCRSVQHPDTESETDLVLDTKNYYFSGVSFSLNPSADITNNAYSITDPYISGSVTITGGRIVHTYQRKASLCILIKDKNGHWCVNEKALLPNIRHGAEPDSIEVDILNATKKLSQDGIPVASLTVKENTYNGGVKKYLLQFTTDTAVRAALDTK